MELSAQQFYHWFGFNRALFRWLAEIHFSAWDSAVGILSAAADPVHFPWYVGGSLLAAYLLPRLVAPGDAITFAIGFAPSMLAATYIRNIVGLPRTVDWADIGLQGAAVARIGDGVPSAAAAFVFLFAASLAPGAPPPVRIALWLCAVLAGTARVAAGMAFPADIAGGAVLAVLIASILRVLLRLTGPGAA